ncbi:MAG: alanine racemase [Phycisphaerales bacterium]
MDASSRLIIDLGAVADNVRAMRHWLPSQTGFAAVVKADAYGLGAVPVARTVARAGASLLAVYDAAEAVELFEAGVPARVMILGPLLRDVVDDWGDDSADGPVTAAAAAGRIHLTVHGNRELDVAGALAARGARAVPVHVEVDTGMSRGGCPPTETPRLIDRILRSPDLALAGVFTHMAEPDDAESVDEQLEIFRAVTSALPPLPGSCRIHVANTRTVLRRPRLAADLVRCGQALSGFGAVEASVDGTLSGPAQPRLKRAVRWVSRIARVREIEPGTTVGYGRRWTARRRTRLGLIPVGYADGYPRPLAETDAGGASIARVGVGIDANTGIASGSASASASADGPRAYAPVVGAISMDQLTIDLTDVADADAQVGAAVELFGHRPDAPNDIAALAHAAGTTHYELLCRLGPRVARAYAEAPAAGAAANGPLVETRATVRPRRSRGAARPSRTGTEGSMRTP